MYLSLVGCMVPQVPWYCMFLPNDEYGWKASPVMNDICTVQYAGSAIFIFISFFCTKKKDQNVYGKK
jgi:hypothetical protein